jgi:PAS domain S-box-containing protein
LDTHSDAEPGGSTRIDAARSTARALDREAADTGRRFPKNTYFWVGVLLGLFWWILESIIHVFIFHEGTIRSQFFSSDPHEVWKRLLVAGLLVVFSLYAQHGINVRRRTEEALATSEKKYRTLIEKALNPVVLFDASGRIHEINDAVLRFLEADRETLSTTSMYELIASADVTETEADDGGSVMLGQLEADFSINGETKTLLMNIVPLGLNGSDLELFFAIGQDFTERKKMERELQLAHADLNQIFQTASSAMRVIDQDFNVLKVNEPFAALSGVSSEAAIGSKCYKIFAGDRCATEDCPLSQILAGRKQIEYEISKTRKNGSEVSCLLTARPFVDSTGRPIAMVESFKEITELTRVQEALRTERDKLRNILFQQYEGVCILRDDFTIEYQNAAMTKELGDCLGKPCYSVFRDADEPCEECFMLEAIESSELRRCECESRGDRVCEHTYTPFVDADQGVKVVVYRRDVTEDKASRAAAIHSEQLAAVGELAAGVAHEINNPMNGIINLAQMLINRERDHQEVRGIGRRIVREGERVATIVASLLSFARRGAPRKTVTTIEELIEESLTLVGAQLRKDAISLEVDIPPDLPSVVCVPQEIEQVFLNLLNNARYALNQRFPEGDTEKVLRIEAREVEGIEGPQVRISFRDCGTGIPADAIGRVMNPFFSTKPKGEGTGLGLSISQDLVRKNAGAMTIESRYGQFTSVNIDLPEIRM